MRKNILIFMCMMALFVFVGCGDEKSIEGKEIDFDYKSINGGDMEIVTFSDSNQAQFNFSKSIFTQNSKRPTLIFFIHKDCSDCLDLLPHIVDIHSRHKDDIFILGLGNAKEEDFLKKTAEKNRVDFPIFINDSKSDVADFWGIANKESNILFFNKNGGKIFHYKGRVPEEMVLFEIKTELESMQN